MKRSNDRLPFWLVALVAGAATFAVVALLGVLLFQPRWNRPGAPSRFPPGLHTVERALEAYFQEHGTYPAKLDVPPVPTGARQPTTTSRPRSAPAGD